MSIKKKGNKTVKGKHTIDVQEYGKRREEETMRKDK